MCARMNVSIDRINAIIEQIMDAGRAKGGSVFLDAERYGDEPLIRRGSQMGGYLPEELRRARDLARSSEARNWTDARLFVEQGRLLADYEDDYPYHGIFQSYFPTYQAMTNQQLRGYFAWRTQVRRGKVEKTSTSFAYVYVYELLNGIGVEPGIAGFETIRAFWQAYREFEPGLDRYLKTWLVDYVAYHGLDPALAAPYLGLEHAHAVETLAEAEASVLATPAPRGRRAPTDFGSGLVASPELFDALDAASSYRPKNSRLYKDAPDDLRLVCCAVFARLARHYRSGHKQGLVATCFGERDEHVYLMFASAVFWPGQRHADCEVELDSSCSYSCTNGLWSRSALHDGGARSAKLGEALRCCDRRLREALDYPHPLKEHGEPKYLLAIVDREVADYLEWKRAHAPREVKIDLGKLAGIRSAAAATREALLVDEEREEEPEPTQKPELEPTPEPLATEPAEPEAAATPAGPAPASAPANDLGLAPDELALLTALLAGKAPAGNVDLLVDSVNEKLFELVGDTVLEFGASGGVELVSDYADDVRAAILGC